MSKTPNFTMEDKSIFIQNLIAEFGDVVTSKQILDYAESQGLAIPYFLLRDEKKKIGRGKFRLCKKSDLFKGPIAAALDKQVDVAPAMVATVTNIASKRAVNITESFIPDVLDTYVPFGFYKDLKSILVSNVFYPIYITGVSGNGKTLMVEQVCADLGRELIRVNITKRTDETDLIGSYELIDGNTIRREGPVVTAMRRGAVLLLDETDYGTEDLLCLQPILEGKPYFDKKTGEVIHPKYGFTIIATANTKGKGSDDGRYIGANVLNEAFLERFAITVEQEFPNMTIERKIMNKNFAVLGIEDDTFADRLVSWAEIIRKSFADGAVDECVSTRRLVHIARAFSIFKDRLKAIELCLNRFDMDTKVAFLDLYTKIDAEAVKTQELPPASEFQHIAIELTKEFNVPVRIHIDESVRTIIVESHGRTTSLFLDELSKSEANAATILKSTVQKHEFLA